MAQYEAFSTIGPKSANGLKRYRLDGVIFPQRLSRAFDGHANASKEDKGDQSRKGIRPERTGRAGVAMRTRRENRDFSMETAMRNFVIAAVAIFAFAGFVTSAEARSKARSFTEAAEFAQDLKSSGQFEIESSNLALRTSSNDEIKKFAQKMIDDHTAADQKLTETLKQENLPGPQYGMDAEGRDLFNQLTVLQGSAFDRAYVRDQIQGHEKAVELLEGYSKRGDNDALKQLASTLLPTIKEHLQMAEGLGSSVTARR